jgi:hypothetical protein
MNRKIALAVGAGVIAAAGVLASAATLGGVTAGSLGTDSAVVAGCTSSGVQIKWNVAPPTYVGSATASNSTFNTLDANVTVPASCDGRTLVLTAAGSGGTSLATSAPTSVSTGANTITLNGATGVDSKLVTQTTVTIYD